MEPSCNSALATNCWRLSQGMGFVLGRDHRFVLYGGLHEFSVWQTAHQVAA